MRYSGTDSPILSVTSIGDRAFRGWNGELMCLSPYFIYENNVLFDKDKSKILITAKPKAHAFKNEMCFPLTKTKCELKSTQTASLSAFLMILIEQRPVYFFFFLPSRFKTTLYVCLNSKSEGCQLFNIFECV